MNLDASDKAGLQDIVDQLNDGSLTYHDLLTYFAGPDNDVTLNDDGSYTCAYTNDLAGVGDRISAFCNTVLDSDLPPEIKATFIDQWRQIDGFPISSDHAPLSMSVIATASPVAIDIGDNLLATISGYAYSAPLSPSDAGDRSNARQQTLDDLQRVQDQQIADPIVLGSP